MDNVPACSVIRLCLGRRDLGRSRLDTCYFNENSYGIYVAYMQVRSVGDRPQLAGCAGASFAMTAIAQLNPDSFVINNGSRATDAAHTRALPARLYIAMTGACATMANVL